MSVSDAFGVYIHIPFCSRRCDYCAFATWDDRGHLQTAYLKALGAEVARTEMPLITSVFVGGGTPSLVSPDQLMNVVRMLPMTDDAEVTVECNPDNVTAELAHTYAAGGVTRISLGVQSMRENVLQILGRAHNPANVRTAVEHIRAAGIKEVNLDLIYGSVGESVEDVRFTVEQVVGLDPNHVSAYGLTVEPGTPLSRDPSRFPDEDDEADKYLVVDSLLESAGYRNYEISNWAKPGSECRHNILYWNQGNYFGFGCAAHSHLNGRRWWNVRTPDRYIDLVASRESVEASSEVLDDAVRRTEAAQLALRMSSGVPRSSFSENDLNALGDHVEITGDRVRLTPTGRLLANEIALRLIVE